MSETHWKQNFNYKYAGAYELKSGETRTVTIKRFGNEEVVSTKGDKQMCFVVYFEDDKKPMVLNKTNCKTIEKLYGPVIENWIGKSIIIEAQRVKAFGDIVDALRVKHIHPKINTLVDIASGKAKIEACTNLDELKQVYMALSQSEKTALLALKDEKKMILEGKIAS
jgi:hypothetical protein